MVKIIAKQTLAVIFVFVTTLLYAQNTNGDATDTPTENEQLPGAAESIDASSVTVEQEYYYLPSKAHGLFYRSGFYTTPAIQQGFHVGLGLGFSSNSTENSESDTSENENYQIFQAQLQYTHNRFSIILDAQFRIAFTLTDTPSVTFATEDWIPEDATDGLKKYIPLLQLRYGSQNDDVYMRVGFLSNITMGNGFLVQDYTNSIDNIHHRVSGIFTRIDGRAFNFPYLGGELLMGDLAQLDTIAARMFSRPLSFLRESYFQEMTIGATFGMNRNKFTSFDNELISSLRGNESTYLAGGDLLLPIIANKNLQIEILADYLWQGKTNHALQVGTQWNIFRILTLDTKFVFLSPHSHAGYFDRNMQQTGIGKSLYAQSFLADTLSNRYLWEARASLSIINNSLIIGAFTRAPFLFDATTLEKTGGVVAGIELRIDEERIEALRGFTLAVHYVKSNIKAADDFVSLANAFIGGKVGFRARGIRIEVLAELRPRYQILHTLLDQHRDNLDEKGLGAFSVFLDQSLSEYTIYTGIQGAISF